MRLDNNNPLADLPTIPEGEPVTEDLLEGLEWAWEDDMLVVAEHPEERQDVHPFFCLDPAEG
jgi:hypothetical protein